MDEFCNEILTSYQRSPLMGIIGTKVRIRESTCDRCKRKMTAWTTSWFNTETICLDCSLKEEAHPRFREAQQAEMQAIRDGNMNFAGIGLPLDLQEWRKDLFTTSPAPHKVEEVMVTDAYGNKKPIRRPYRERDHK